MILISNGARYNYRSVLSELINQDGSLNTSQNNKIIFDDELSEDQDLFANNVATEENTLDASKIKKHKKRKIKIEVSDELLEVEETKTKKKKKQKSTEGKTLTITCIMFHRSFIFITLICGTLFADEADFQEKVCETQNEAVMDTTSGTKKRKRSRSGDDVDGIKIKRKKHKGIYTIFFTLTLGSRYMCSKVPLFSQKIIERTQ